MTELAGVSSLADRELEVFQLLGRGKGMHDIAGTLNLSDSTIDTYRARMKEQFPLSSAAELYLRAGAWVREHGLWHLDTAGGRRTQELLLRQL